MINGARDISYTKSSQTLILKIKKKTSIYSNIHKFQLKEPQT